MPEIIEAEKLIAVEGKDEITFFRTLLNHLSIKEVQLEDVGGKTQMSTKLPALCKIRGFSKVKLLAIIRDADSNASDAFRSVCKILTKLKLIPPSAANRFSNGTPKIGIFIMPGNSETGMLENLCLETVQNKPAYLCAKNFVKCCKNLDEIPNNIPKAMAQAYLAAMPKIVNSVGNGALKGYWNFDSNSTCLNNLKIFLINFK